MAKKMDEMGEWWCLRNMPEILGVMAAEAEKRKLAFSRWKGRVLICSAVALSLASKWAFAENAGKHATNLAGRTIIS
jgi:hypothetical protein